MSWYYSAIGSKSLEKSKFPSIKDSESAKRAPTIIKISWLNQRWCHWWWIDLWTCPSITRIDQNATRMLHIPNCIMTNLPVKERQAISLRTYLAKACERFTIVTSVPKWQEPSPFYSTKDCPNCSIWVQPAHGVNLPTWQNDQWDKGKDWELTWTGAAVGPVGISESSSANTFLPSFTNQPKTHWVSQCAFTAYHSMCLQSSLMGTINSTQSPGNLSKGKWEHSQSCDHNCYLRVHKMLGMYRQSARLSSSWAASGFIAASYAVTAP